MPDILASAQKSTPILPAGLDLPYSIHGSGLPPEPEPEPTPTIPSPVDKKHGNKSLVLAVLLFLVATLPLAVYFTSQQRQLADLRGRAQEGPYPCTSPNVCVTSPLECRDGGGQQVSQSCPSGRIGVCCNFGSGTNTPTPTPTPQGGACPGKGGLGQVCRVPQNCNNLPNCDGTLACISGVCQQATAGQCGSSGRCRIHICDKCSNYGGGLDECRSGGQEADCASAVVPAGQCGQVDILDGSGSYCGVKQQACTGSCSGGPAPTTPPPGGTPPPESTPTPTTPPGNTPTPTPTPVPGGTCELIKLYDAAGTTEITQAVRDGTKKLALGEQVIIATSKGNATKARFRIQGVADWTENDTSKTTATEYRLGITIPSTLTQAQGTFEVEVFVNGVWK